MKKGLYALLLVMVLAAGLAACGDATNTASLGAAATASGGMMMSPGATMAGMTMPAGTAMSSAMTTVAGSRATDPMTESLKGLSGKEFETVFMQDMIAHHQSAVEMAGLIPTHTKRPELLTLGQSIVSSQNKETGDMTGWLASWYTAKPLADGMNAPGMMAMMGDMDKLKNAKDADFDRLFLQMMIPHHQGAVSMSNLLPAKTQRPELLKLGQDIIKAQTAEITQMQGWQKAWF